MPRRTRTTATLLNGDDLRQMLAAGLASLELHVAIINALNVFPVPDGDTGTNMYLTLKSAKSILADSDGSGVGALAEAVARETLMSARGNSGVILSQVFRGWATALREREVFGADELAQALHQGAVAAYKAVSQPVEGTILTVVKEAAAAAQAAVGAGEKDPAPVWKRACQAARKALAETPELLPVLKEAGVVDAGGLGLVAVMEGMLAHLQGREAAPLDLDVGQVAPSAAYLSSTEEMGYGYCTQFLVQGTGLDSDTVRERLASLADSAVVVGDQAALKVHVHAADPGPVISYAVSLGTISQVRIDDMDQQHQEFLEQHRGRQQESVPVGVVAVAAGQGVTQIFRQLGALDVVPGGQTMNPSTRDLVEHVCRAPSAAVILLPNNPNIVATARQASTVSSTPMHVLPTTSIPQGVAALLAFNPGASVDANLAQMRNAMSSVRSGEVTRAVRSTSIGGRRVRQGQAIGFLDGDLTSVADTPPEALKALCMGAHPAEGALITIYWGGDASEAEARATAEAVRAVCPGVEVELVHGGQPHYDYLVSFE